jgi:hypothetical protein
MCASVARAVDGVDAAHRSGADHRHLRAILAYGDIAPPLADADRDGLARHMGRTRQPKVLLPHPSWRNTGWLKRNHGLKWICCHSKIGNPLSPRLSFQQEITRFHAIWQNFFLVKGQDKGDYKQTILRARRS